VFRRIQAWCAMSFEETPGHVFTKTGVETRTVIARMALRRLRWLYAPFEVCVQAFLASSPHDIRELSYAIDSELNPRPAGFHDGSQGEAVGFGSNLRR
jgi:hypothetical protein